MVEPIAFMLIIFASFAWGYSIGHRKGRDDEAFRRSQQ